MLRRGVASWLGYDVGRLAGWSAAKLIRAAEARVGEQPEEPAAFALRPEGTDRYGVRERSTFFSLKDAYRHWSADTPGVWAWSIAFFAMWGGEWRAFVAQNSGASLLADLVTWYRSQDWGLNQERYVDYIAQAA